jgi:hypothetical protein
MDAGTRLSDLLVKTRFAHKLSLLSLAILASQISIQEFPRFGLTTRPIGGSLMESRGYDNSPFP